ncbi:MAG: hypothetical protein JWM28_4106 [Chitinophagaceae bacterium]|nr:hypothetical protein [Chitinophagaceae bacterium]
MELTSLTDINANALILHLDCFQENVPLHFRIWNSFLELLFRYVLFFAHSRWYSFLINSISLSARRFKSSYLSIACLV